MVLNALKQSGKLMFKEAFGVSFHLELTSCKYQIRATNVKQRKLF